MTDVLIQEVSRWRSTHEPGGAGLSMSEVAAREQLEAMREKMTDLRKQVGEVVWLVCLRTSPSRSLHPHFPLANTHTRARARAHSHARTHARTRTAVRLGLGPTQFVWQVVREALLERIAIAPPLERGVAQPSTVGEAKAVSDRVAQRHEELADLLQTMKVLEVRSVRVSCVFVARRPLEFTVLPPRIHPEGS